MSAALCPGISDISYQPEATAALLVGGNSQVGDELSLSHDPRALVTNHFV
jgi:hypothetical protein